MIHAMEMPKIETVKIKQKWIKKYNAATYNCVLI